MPRTINFYMDDSGTRRPDRHKLEFDPNRRMFFALGGVLVDDQHEASVRALVEDFCSRWGIDYPLHSVEIRHSSGRYSWLRRDAEEYRRFMRDLTRLVCRAEVVALACVIDRPGYDARYREQFGRQRWMLCRTAFAVAVERAAKHALKQKKKLRVFPERCSKDDDARLKGYFDEMRSTGLPFSPAASARYRPLSQADLHSALYEIKFKYKTSRMAQLADLLLWPVAMAGYDAAYLPYVVMKDAGRLIECSLGVGEIGECGTKYSCFDLVDQYRRTGT